MGKDSQGYREVAHEILADLENSVVELDKTPEDTDLIESVFRAMNTIQGSGAMFGFDDITAFAYEVETVFCLVREGKIPVSKEFVDLTLSASDQIGKMVDGEEIDEALVAEIVKKFNKMLPDGSGKGKGEPEIESPGSDHSESKMPPSALKNMTYRIRFRPNPDIFKTATNPVPLLDELRDLGVCRVVAQTKEIPQLEDLDPVSCHIFWDIILTTPKSIDAVRDVFLFVEDDSEVHINVIDEGESRGEDSDYKLLGEILVERGDVSSKELKVILEGRKCIGEMMVEAGIIGQGAVESALVEQEHVRQLRKRSAQEALASSIRVQSEKLDNLVGLVGKLVISQERLSQAALRGNDPDVISVAEDVEWMTAELRDKIMNIRMVPIGTTFTKFKRLVQDLSREQGKEVILKIEGGETELDKTIVDRLYDPLVHIIRNSIEHGIESPIRREASGKPRHGTVHLSVFHSGANILIRISDDGAGLNTNTIRSKAIEKDLVTKVEDLTDKGITSIIFSPGFSTAKEVTGDSEQGMGMDAVKLSIRDLGGSIWVISQNGKGVTITLKLPHTSATIEGLTVNVGEKVYVFPLSVVKECTELRSEDMEISNGRKKIKIGGEIIPYLRLREMFDVEGELPPIEQIVIVKVNGDRVGFGVDHITGEYQTVIKALGKVYKETKGVSGATILEDGTVALILEPTRLVQIAEKEAMVLSGARG